MRIRNLENPHLDRFEISDIQGSEETDFFDINGYLIISNVLSKETTERFKLDVKRVINAQLHRANEDSLDEKSEFLRDAKISGNELYQELIKEKSVDYLCRGEGETAFLELIKRVTKGQTIKGLLNIWGKEKGKIIND